MSFATNKLYLLLYYYEIILTGVIIFRSLPIPPPRRSGGRCRAVLSSPFCNCSSASYHSLSSSRYKMEPPASTGQRLCFLAGTLTCGDFWGGPVAAVVSIPSDTADTQWIYRIYHHGLLNQLPGAPRRLKCAASSLDTLSAMAARAAHPLLTWDGLSAPVSTRSLPCSNSTSQSSS